MPPLRCHLGAVMVSLWCQYDAIRDAGEKESPDLRLGAFGFPELDGSAFLSRGPAWGMGQAALFEDGAGGWIPGAC